ncbi:MAG TPA: ABC transporter permease [Roseiarcus sp.]|nr:ABC transporter permease [Roseiarcus sp.]
MSAAGEALPRAASAAAASLALGRLDKLGAAIAAIVAIALFAEPFATLRPNRIVSGKGLAFWDALPASAGSVGAAMIIAGAVVALVRGWQRLRLAAGASALAAVLVLLGLVPGHLVAPGNSLARVGAATGFWMLVFAFSILVTDAIAKLDLGPAARLAALAIAALVVGAILGSGLWSGLSVMREYATHADSFWQDGERHVELTFGSLAAALIVGAPLGVACQRSPALGSVTLPVLNIIQTIPSIAMYGLMMAPLALLAVRFPALEEIGVRGIGPAPALIALFLYSLLPVVANVVVGLRGIPDDVVEAARGMGLTARQRLFWVELPLAMPVILTGVRIVLVQNIGLVTVAALIGAGGFGEFVFQGLGQSATDLVLLGAVPTVALAFVAAILLDALVEVLGERRK